MNISIRNRKSRPTEINYSSTAIPASNDAVIKHVEALVKGAPEEMRRLAVNGADDTQASSPLRRIRTEIDECITRETHEANKNMRAFMTQMGTIEAIDPELHLANVGTTILSETRQRMDDAVTAKASAIYQRNVKQEFIGNRGIQRQAETPMPAATGFFITGCLSIELCAGYLLYNDSEASSGLALFIAALCSGTIAGTALATGFWGVRSAFNGYRWPERIIGSIFTAIGLFMILYVALIVSHDRDHLATYNPDQAFVRRFDWALIFHPADWFHYETIEGPLFLLLLLLLAVLSIWKGVTGFSDPIPGYTKHFENWRNAENAADNQVRALREAAKAPLDRETALIDQKLNADRLVLKKADEISEQAGNHEHRYSDAITLLTSIADTAISKAQEAYLEVRPQRPAYFDQFFGQMEIPNLSITAIDIAERRQLIENNVEANRKHAIVVKTGLNRLFHEWDERLQDHLASLEELGAAKCQREHFRQFRKET